MSDSYELRVWADGVVTDTDGNVIEQPQPEETEPETEESQP